MQILRFLPGVEDDAFAGYAWYEEKEQGLGDEFLRKDRHRLISKLNAVLLAPVSLLR